MNKDKFYETNKRKKKVQAFTNKTVYKNHFKNKLIPFTPLKIQAYKNCEFRLFFTYL